MGIFKSCVQVQRVKDHFCMSPLPSKLDQTPDDPDQLAAAFEHSITWEDDLWRADPVDVEAVHAKARARYYDLLDAVTSANFVASKPRILLFHGQSGAGKTHLIRALRTGSHRRGKAYFGYAQMTPDVSSYADYYLRRLVNSLEKPFDPDNGGESALARLTRRLVGDADVMDVSELSKLREAELAENELARFILDLADDIVASPKFAEESLDINLVRALLYLQRADPRIDSRVRQYLQGRQLTDLARAAVAALDPNSGDGRAFEIIESLGKLMWSVDRAALVFCIDQVEDLRNFSDAEERFQKAVGNLMQIANRVPRSIIIISCLEEFYGQARAVLPQSYIDRVEKAGPIALLGKPHAGGGAADHRQASRASGVGPRVGPELSRPLRVLRAELLRGVRRPVDAPPARARAEPAALRQRRRSGVGMGGRSAPERKPGFLNSLVAALGFAPSNDEPASAPEAASVDYRETWERFSSARRSRDAAPRQRHHGCAGRRTRSRPRGMARRHHRLLGQAARDRR